MTKSNGGRPSKTEIAKRRERVRELFLKGKTPYQMSRILGSSYNTILEDVQHLQARYTTLITRNPELAKRQLARVEQLLDEVSIMKDEYWTLYNEIQEKVKENKKKLKIWEQNLKSLDQELQEAEAAYLEDHSKENRIKARELRKKYDRFSREPKYPTYITARIDALKAILDRIDKEAKLLNLFNPQALIDKSYVSIEVLKSIMEVFRAIVMDLVPEDRRMYAFKRLKTIDIQSLSGDAVVDAEFREERPKKTKEISVTGKPTHIKLSDNDDEEIDI